ncbi:NUDIX domain-containing protein [Aliikangiella sp. G2MR2-5]|uniref:NUDIX domain-containing protein n=1 Tax=Aliikangiella sp. G2MR2-5 TaxID=2788943 RepID=UPI0018ABD5A8
MAQQTRIVSGLIVEDQKVLLCFRINTKHFPLHWSLPVGHIESHENEQDALRRELFEELAIQVIDSVKLTTLYDNENEIEHSVYRVSDWRGQIKNREPHLCQKIGWFSFNELPTPLTPPTQTILSGIDYEQD